MNPCVSRSLLPYVTNVTCLQEKEPFEKEAVALREQFLVAKAKYEVQCVCMYIWQYVCAYVCVHTQTFTHTHAHTHTSVCLDVIVYARMFVRI